MNRPLKRYRKIIKGVLNEVVDHIKLPLERHKCPHCFKNLMQKKYVNENNSPDRNSPSRKLICHHCKKDLPMDFFESKEYTILVIGKMDTGKSTFMTVLLTILLGQKGHRYLEGIHAKIINQEAEIRLLNHQFELYDHKSRLEGNAGMEVFEPYILRIFRSSKRRIKTHFYHFHDIPGEEFQNINNLLNRRKNLNHADAILFLIDPLQIKKIATEIGEDFEPQKNTKPDELLHKVLEVWSKNETYSSQRKIEIPIGICLSKVDMVKSISTFYLQDELDREFFSWEENIQEIPHISEDCRDFLEYYDEKLINLIETKFKTVCYFPISPLGFNPTMNQGMNRDIEPQGVMSPFMWLLSYFKF